MNNKNKLDEVTEGGENVPVALPGPPIPTASHAPPPPMAATVSGPEKSEKEEGSDRSEKSEKQDKSDRSEKSGRQQKSGKQEKSGKQKTPRETDEEPDDTAFTPVPAKTFEKLRMLLPQCRVQLKPLAESKGYKDAGKVAGIMDECDTLIQSFNHLKPTTPKEYVAERAKLSPLIVLAVALLAPMVVALITLFVVNYKFGRADQDMEAQFAALKDKEITTLRKALTDQRETLNTIDKQTQDRPTTGGLDKKSKDELVAEIKNAKLGTADVNVLRDIPKRIDALPGKIGGGGLPQETVDAIKKFSEDAGKFDAIPKAVKDLEKEKEALVKEKEALAKEKEALAKLRDAAQASARKPFEDATNKMVEAIKAANRQAEGPKDIWLVGMDSPRLAMANFRKEFNETIGKMAREPNAPRRAGLALARSSSLTVIAKPDDPAKVDLDKLGQPTQGMTGVPGVEETPAEFGLALHKAFDGKRSNAQNRVILFGSAECPPLGKETPGWQDMSEIHVVLLQSEGGTQASRAATLDRLLKWQEFCLDRQGTLTLIPAAEANKSAKIQAVLDRLMK